MTFYWAGPLHDKEDQERNIKYVSWLRRAGHQVYLPQEHGILEEMKDSFTDETSARFYLYSLDMNAMQECQACIACCGDTNHPREPSEGMMWEMGYMRGCNKPVYIFNPDMYYRYNLMPHFGATKVFSDFEELIKFLENEQPR